VQNSSGTAEHGQNANQRLKGQKQENPDSAAEDQKRDKKGNEMDGGSQKHKVKHRPPAQPAQAVDHRGRVQQDGVWGRHFPIFCVKAQENKCDLRLWKPRASVQGLLHGLCAQAESEV